MSVSVRLDEDYHVHSTFSQDAVSTLAENLQAARERGLRTICLAEHVRQDSAHLPEFLAAVAALPRVPGLRVLAGAEAKILDTRGHLDLPAEASGLDMVLIADHQFPGDDGPRQPGEVRAALAAGELGPAGAVECLAGATIAALRGAAGGPGLSLAHLFSILPKIGLAETAVPDALLARLAAAVRQAGAVVEVNEKWACPSARVLDVLARAGVTVVAATDSHRCAEVGVYHRVRQLTGTGAAAGRA